MRVRTRDLRFGYRDKPVLNGVDIDEAATGTVTAVIGPNAAGKSTLFRCMAGLLRARGDVFLDGRSIRSYRRGTERSRIISYLPQGLTFTAALTVFEAVLLARQQTANWTVSGPDLDQVWAALDRFELTPLADSYLNELSGGQRQMVGIAQAVVREPRVLLLDEPTSSLDLQHQLELLGSIRQIAAEREVTVFVSIHDLNLAARFADRIIVLHHGRVLASGAPREVLTEHVLWEVYGVLGRVGTDPAGIPVVTPIRSARRDLVPAIPHGVESRTV